MQIQFQRGFEALCHVLLCCLPGSFLSNQRIVWRLLLLGCKVSESSQFGYLSCPLAIANTSSNSYLGIHFCYHITSEKHTRMYRPFWHNTLRLGRGTGLICERSVCSAQDVMKLNSAFSLWSYWLEPQCHTFCREKRLHMLFCWKVKTEGSPQNLVQQSQTFEHRN